MVVYQGEKLKNHVTEALDSSFKERFLLEDLHKYMTSENDRKICCLYGLRRTGKTIMTLQEMRKLDNYSGCLLVRCEDGDTMWQVRQAIEKTLEDNPRCRNIFIDEATKAENFINTCSFLADDYAARGIKVVMAGTDSLGFFMAKNSELFDRVHLLHTTYIPFKEYNYVLGKGIRDYIEYGGTFTDGVDNVFYNGDRANLYTNSAIVENISNTIKKWNNSTNYGQGALRDIIDHDDFTSFVKKVLEMDNRKFLASIINSEFKSHDLGSLAQLLTKHNIADPVALGTKEMSDRACVFLGIKENHFEAATEEAVNTIILYLKSLDVLYEIPKTAYLSSGRDMLGEGEDREYIFTQTGMRCCQATELAEALITSEEFQEYTRSQKMQILDKLKGDIHRRILENIVFYQLSREADEKDKREIVKYKDAVNREIDVIVLDYTEQTQFEIEVKLSGERNDKQTARLRDKSLCEEIENKTGLVAANKAVVYTGENGETEDGILYLNADDFLKRSREIVDILVKEPVTSYKRLQSLLASGTPQESEKLKLLQEGRDAVDK